MKSLLKNPQLISIPLIFFVVSFASAWTLRIYHYNVVLVILLNILSLSLTFHFLKIINGKIFITIIYLTLLLVNIYFISQTFDKQILRADSSGIVSAQVRSSYYPLFLGKIIHNQTTLSLYKLEKNFFTNLDWNQFFFGGAPRYRNYAIDYGKFNFLFLPFFILGVFYFFTKKPNHFYYPIIIFSLIFITQSFSNPGNKLSSIIFYPIFLSLITSGLYNYFYLSYKYLKRP